MKERLGEWYPYLEPELNKPYFDRIVNIVGKAADRGILCPEPEDVFNVFKMSPDKVKVVILGQDPYINGEAHGYAFSSKIPKIPPSLRIIYKELGMEPVAKLDHWIEQGVFLINRALTTTKGNSNAHQGIGWQLFTDAVIKIIAKLPQPKVFMLWGKNAQEVERLINTKEISNLVLKAPHPAADSYPGYSGRATFAGSNHFEKANKFLSEHNVEPIIW